jgi:hypothetical protein
MAEDIRVVARKVCSGCDAFLGYPHKSECSLEGVVEVSATEEKFTSVIHSDEHPPVYDSFEPSQRTPEECEAAVGKRATLTLTGAIVESGVTDGVGPWVKFRLDERWGFRTNGNHGPSLVIGMDLDAFEVEEG